MKGISHAVETYEVMDSYEALGRQTESIVEAFPHFALNIDLQKLSHDGRHRASAVLADALAKLG